VGLTALDALAAALGPAVQRNVPLAPHTAMRVGGPADLLWVCERTDDLLRAISLARRHGVDWRILGGGCNVLVSDEGLRGLVILYRAAQVTFEPLTDPDDWVTVQAESGALLAVVAREAVARAKAGLEWAVGLPGSVGGAVVGNAGAFGGDIAHTLHTATVLGPGGEVVERPAEWFEFDYRTSRIKRQSAAQAYVVLAATFRLPPGDPVALANRAREIAEWRRTRHPAGATMGSTFKNPPGGHAGRLIEEAGLKGYRIGGAQVSEQHANFLMNTGHATAADVWALIQHVQATVRSRLGVTLELEIERLGDW